MMWRCSVHFLEGTDEVFAFIISAHLGNLLDRQVCGVQQIQCFFIDKKPDVGLWGNTKCLFIKYGKV